MFFKDRRKYASKTFGMNYHSTPRTYLIFRRVSGIFSITIQ